jgi:DNA topoisomerase-2
MNTTNNKIPKNTIMTEVEDSSMNLSQQYQRKTDKQHILDNPDTYIGSVENVDANMWVCDDNNRIVLKQIEYIPGLYKLFDEGIVNCRDHVIRMITQNGAAKTADSASDKKCVSYIETTIDEDGTITFENDGNGIDIAKHPEYDIWIPEMIFGHLRTSTNYNKDEKRIVGGKNGFGFKLVLIWSGYGRIETVDHIRGLKYTQEFHNNLTEISKPIIKAVKNAKPYTKVTFKPDYTRFGAVNGLTPDMRSLLQKRVYDISAVTDNSHNAKKIKVTYNGSPVPIKNFQQYIDLYIGKKDESKRVYEEASERWEYAVALSPTHQFEQISFVNGICTFKGGKHVDYIIGQITRKLSDYIEKKKKIKVNPNTIKEQLILFLRSDIENPAFDSQTKDYMNTPSNKFGSSCNISDSFIEKIAKMGVMEAACSLTELKERNIAKKTDGTKTKTVRGIANFIDANFAGTNQSKDCILILCEGLSAMSGIISGLTSEDRNKYGIYPLKGKLLNVRGETIKKISENKEITDMKRILGLETGKVYESIENLRYGKIMILTDSDVDGSHIKGLCVNLFQSEWVSLFRITGFISFMNTPILRAKKNQQTHLFYNEGEYDTWKNTIGGNVNGWTIKYFKGLGTSTSIEFKEYFANKKFVDFSYSGEVSDQIIDKIFNKKRADERKTWLEQYDKHSYLNTSLPSVKYEDFVDKELIHFSIYDCERSIPNMVDGLKISLRKVLYCAFKRKLISEVKVAQFSGYVSEHSEYRHGEASLNGCIVGMAQNFVGSNNINLLMPNGQMGTRLQGGSDAASERYIYTMLTHITRALFPEKDDPILHYLNEDGTMIEPEYYIPILPFVLVNGISGIGTGFSSNLPAFNPKQIVQYIRNSLTNIQNTDVFIPYYENFTGTVKQIEGETTKFLIKGSYSKFNDELHITELPVGTWTMPYITFLESLMDGGVDKTGKKIAPVIKDFISNSTEKIVDIRITFAKGRISELEGQCDASGINGIEKTLKLTTTVSTTNMHLFDKDCKLHKYHTVEEIIDAFSNVRLKAYQTRKDYLICELQKVLVKLTMKAKYIQLVLNSTIDLRYTRTDEINTLLETNELIRIDESFDYLIKMPMVSVSLENVEKLMKEKGDIEHELEALNRTTIQDMWLCELNNFENVYNTYIEKRTSEYSNVVQGDGVKPKKTAKKSIKK